MFEVWKSQLPRIVKAIKSQVLFVFSLAVWVHFFSWEFGLVYGCCFFTLFALLLVSTQKSKPLASSQSKGFKRVNVSSKQLLRVVILFSISVILAGTITGCIALALPLFFNYDLANSLVFGLFLYLLLWPVSIVWVLSRQHLLKLSLITSWLAFSSFLLVYYGSV